MNDMRAYRDLPVLTLMFLLTALAAAIQIGVTSIWIVAVAGLSLYIFLLNRFLAFVQRERERYND